jgi:glycosyltransferase involved in cell wall biosynthesis
VKKAVEICGVILYVHSEPMPPDPAHIAVVIAAFNEEESIGAVISEVRGALERLGLASEIIVVNDGSTDGTASVVRGGPCTLLNLPYNVGKGAASQLGFRYAMKRGCDTVIQVDGDGQHPASEIYRLLEPLRQGVADVVIGSRFMGNGGSRSTFGRRIGIRYFNVLQGLLIRQKITDSTSGFRAMNDRVLALCVKQYPDQYPEPEAIVIFRKHNLRIMEVPVTMDKRHGGHSSIDVFDSLLYMFNVTLAMLMTMLRTHH